MKNFDFDLSAFFEITPDLVWIASKDGYLKKVNTAVIQKLGYTETELYKNPISSFIHPDDRENTRLNRAKLINGEVLHNFLNRYITKQGEIIWLEWTSIYFADKELVFAIAKDVTVRKQIEKDVADEYNKFKSLASHFKSSIEKDRKHFAYELHEELAQLVSVINMDVRWIAGRIDDMPGNLKDKIDHASEVSKLMIKTIQRLSFALSPQMLDDFGLNATLEWLCKEFSILNGISCVFESAYDEADLTHEMKIDFFRICQESLTHVLDFSLASKVKISIEDAGDRIRLCIRDNGKGFAAEKERQAAGFINIRERAVSINAQINLVSNIDETTCICLTVPKSVQAYQ
jgi:PAS domain S-box-containing protein